MREEIIAEWILSLAISPERAASTLGDLLEECQTRGRVWFWWGVLGTALSHLWHDLQLHPGWAAGRALWGFGATIVYTALLGFPLFMFLPRVNTDGPGFTVSAPSPWAAPILIGAMCSVIPFVVAWQNARLSHGRELASAIAMIVMRVLVNLLFACWSAAQMRQIGKPTGLTEDSRMVAAASACVILGAMFQRRRALRQASGVPHA